MLLLLCACACTFRKTEEYDVEEIINHHNKAETVGVAFHTEVEWIVEPSMVLESVEMIKTEPPLGYPYLEHIGHPQEWDYMAGKGPFIVDEAEYTGAPVYTSDAIIVYRYENGLLSPHSQIYDYDGNLLSAVGTNVYDTEAGVDADSTRSKLFRVYSSDFIGTIERNGIVGLCGGSAGLFEYNGTLYIDVTDYDEISRKITSFGCDLGFEEINIEEYLNYRKATADDLFGHRTVVSVYNKIVSAVTNYDCAVYDEKGNRMFVFDNTEETWVSDFSNGFLTIRKLPKDGGTADIRYAFYSVDDQNYITDFDYEEALPFVEGYAAVRKDGKWAYINEKGEPVTDFIWDSVSTMYEGRVYVGLKDRFGILDLKGTLVKGAKVTMETCYGSADPQMAYEAVSALEEFVPKQKERDPENVAKEEEFEKAHKIIGIIIPKYDDINVREEPSTTAKIVGVLRNSGTAEEESYYPQYVYETTEAEGYTWYRIGTDRWVADHGNWYDVEMFAE